MRIRTIKPEFWTHPVISRLDAFTRLTAIGLLNVADDGGYFLADPGLVRAAVHPFLDDSSTVHGAIQSLSNAGWIEVRKHPTHGAIGWVVNFSKHQVISHAKPSKLKAYFDSMNSPGTVHERSAPEWNGTGNGMEVEVEVESNARERAKPLPPPPAIPAGEEPFDGQAVTKAMTHPEPDRPRSRTLGDLEALHPRLIVYRDDRQRAETMVTLYTWDVCHASLTALDAKPREAGKPRIMLSELAAYLERHYEPDPEDYERAGLPIPEKVK